MVLSETHAHLAAVKGTYSAYKSTTHVACHECVAWLHEHKGAGPYPRPAHVVRRTPGHRVEVAGFAPYIDGATMLPLCNEHADLWKVRDGIGVKIKVGGK